MAMAEARRKFDLDFREGEVRLVRETGRPIAQNPSTTPLKNGRHSGKLQWLDSSPVAAYRARFGDDDRSVPGEVNLSAARQASKSLVGQIRAGPGRRMSNSEPC
jgi:hypothetical protein